MQSITKSELLNVSRIMDYKIHLMSNYRSDSLRFGQLSKEVHSLILYLRTVSKVNRAVLSGLKLINCNDKIS